jgi:hypothetical protein
MKRTVPLPIAALALVAACEMKINADEKAEAGGQPAASATGKAEEGSISVDAPGLDLKLNIPDALRAQVGADGDILYPGSKLAGLHVQANDGSGAGEDSVELRFTAPDPVAKVAGWYRDPGQAKELTIASAAQQGQGYRIAGTSKGDGDPFTLVLMPAAGGGTEGRIVLQDRHGR